MTDIVTPSTSGPYVRLLAGTDDPDEMYAAYPSIEGGEFMDDEELVIPRATLDNPDELQEGGLNPRDYHGVPGDEGWLRPSPFSLPGVEFVGMVEVDRDGDTIFVPVCEGQYELVDAQFIPDAEPTAASNAGPEE